MKKNMSLIFDIDDTIVDESGFMIKYAPEYLRKKHKLSGGVINPNGCNVSEVFDFKKIFLKKGLTPVEVESKCKKITNGFWETNFVKYTSQPVLEGVKETTDNLHKEGYKIYFVSLRGKRDKSKLEKPLDRFIHTVIVPFLTKLQLKSNKINYDQLILVEDIEEKLDVIRNLQPDYVFEDQANIINSIPKTTKVVCINRNHNINAVFSDNVIRINGYKNDEALNIISSSDKNDKINHGDIDSERIMSKIKNLNINYYKFCKKVTENFYELFRNPITKWIKNNYNPLLYGVDNIPYDNRPIVLISNHRHNLDPLFPSMVLKKPIHWTADLKMFIGKQNLFTTTEHPIICYVSALFMKAIGAFPIGREKDKEKYGKKYNSTYKLAEVNAKTFAKAGICLDLGGVVGLYPEGTINRKPNEQNIVPLKSTRAFRLAVEHYAYVLPVSMVWIPKGIGIENRTIMKFSPVIDTKNKTIDEVATLWKQIVNQDIEKINNIVLEMKKNNDQNNNSDQKRKIK